jgi:hypothetical protein
LLTVRRVLMKSYTGFPMATRSYVILGSSHVPGVLDEVPEINVAITARSHFL